MAHSLDLVWVYGKLETNTRVRLQGAATGVERETALSSRRDESLWQLEAYFPFDPYLLPRSKRWIETDYRSWDEEGLEGYDEKDGVDFLGDEHETNEDKDEMLYDGKDYDNESNDDNNVDDIE